MATMGKIFDGYFERQRALQSSTNPFSAGVAWVDGKITPIHLACIPMMDQGFLHSDLIYDSASVWDSRLFRIDDHLDRFEASCAKLRLRLPLQRHTIKKTLLEMLVKSKLRDAYVTGHKVADLENRLYMYILPYNWVMSPETQRAGTGSAIVARTVRRTPPESQDPTIKSMQWADFTKGLIEAEDREADLPFLVDGDGNGNLTEGSGFNIFIIKDGVLHTPVRGMLEGVTRKSVIEVAEAEGIAVSKETTVPAAMCYICDECFICSTAGAIMPITKLDGKPVGDGEIGPLTKNIWDSYWALHYNDQFSLLIDYGDES